MASATAGSISIPSASRAPAWRGELDVGEAVDPLDHIFVRVVFCHVADALEARDTPRVAPELAPYRAAQATGAHRGVWQVGADGGPPRSAHVSTEVTPLGPVLLSRATSAATGRADVLASFAHLPAGLPGGVVDGLDLSPGGVDGGAVIGADRLSSHFALRLGPFAPVFASVHPCFHAVRDAAAPGLRKHRAREEEGQGDDPECVFHGRQCLARLRVLERP